MADVKVSIIIPLYNGAAEIGETLRALGEQMYKNLEIIIVDDGSKDDAASAIAAAGDARVTYVRQENQGPAAARNNGFARSTGEYIMFLDHDDILLPTAIEEAVRFLDEQHEYGAVYFDFRYYMNSHPPIYYRHRLAHDWEGNVFDNLLRVGPMCNPSQTLLRRSALAGATYETALVGSDDWDYFLQVASRGALFGFIPKVLVNRELSQSSFTGGMAGRVKTKNSSIRLYEKWMKALPKEKVEALGLPRVLERILLKRAFVMLMDKQYGVKDIKEALRSLLHDAKDAKTRFQARSFLIAASILPISLLKAIAEFIDRTRIKHNFVVVSQ